MVFVIYRKDKENNKTVCSVYEESGFIEYLQNQFEYRLKHYMHITCPSKNDIMF